jgi:hypothetical protein
LSNLSTNPRRAFGATERQSCATETCFATFDSTAARPDEVRHCNRGGPDGGHPNRWDGIRWQTGDGRMQHDLG